MDNLTSPANDDFDNLDLDIAEIEDLEYQATQYYSTQHVSATKVDKEHETAFFSYEKSKRKTCMDGIEPPCKSARLLTDSPHRISSQSILDYGTLHIYQIIDDIQHFVNFEDNLKIIENIFELLNDRMYCMEPGALECVISFCTDNFNTKLFSNSSLKHSIFPILGSILRRDCALKQEFYEKLLNYIYNGVIESVNIIDLEFISNLILEISYKNILEIFSPTNCLISKFCESFRSLYSKPEDGFDAILPIIYSIQNAAGYQESITCNCLHNYFDTLFSFVQILIINIQLLTAESLYFDKSINIIYECIKQIFIFSKTIVGSHTHSRLNIRHQYLLLAGAPLIYRYRKMTLNEIKEMDELMEHIPGHEV